MIDSKDITFYRTNYVRKGVPNNTFLTWEGYEDAQSKADFWIKSGVVVSYTIEELHSEDLTKQEIEYYTSTIRYKAKIGSD
jgi:hypothetical protein